MAKSNFIVRGGANFNPLYQEFNKAQKKINGFQKSINNSMKIIGTALGSIAVGKLIKDSTKAAMGVESSMDNIARNMGESSKAFNEWVNTQSKSLAMAKDEAYQYGSTFSNLLGSFLADSKETANQTQELMKAAAIISSKTGRTYDDVANRIRSGMLGSTEAIEDLGVYTQVSMLESTEAFKKFANGKSWNQLNFQTQQQIRLAAILEQAYSRYGDTLAGTTQTKQQIFLATLKNIRLNLGQAFLPIYNVILPALTSLASKIESITASLAAFSQALFGKSVKAQTKQTQAQTGAVGELGDATEEAGKQAKGALAGFDEINQLSLNEGGAGTETGIADIGLEQIEDGTGGAFEEVGSKAEEMANKVKSAFDKIKNSILKNKNIIISAISGIVAAFASFEVIKNWPVIVGAVSNAFLALKTAILAINAPLVGIAALIGLLVTAVVDLWQKNEEFRNSVISVWEHIKSVLTTIVKDTWNIIKSVWNKYGASLINNLKGFIKSIQDLILNVWNTVLEPIITNALNMLSWLWDKHLKGVVEQLATFIIKLADGILEIWNKFFAPWIDFLVTLFGPTFVAVIDYIVDTFGTLVAVVADVVKGLLQVLNGLIDFIVAVFTGDWERAWTGVVEVFKGIVTMIAGIFKGVLNATIDVINFAVQGVVGAINGMIQGAIRLINKVPGLELELSPIRVPKIPKLATGGITDINSPFLAMVGDNRTQREVIAPLDDLTDMIASAVGSGMMAASQFNSSGSSDRELSMYIDSAKMAKVILSALNTEAQRQGYKPILQTT
jgi:phage-related protein